MIGSPSPSSVPAVPSVSVNTRIVLPDGQPLPTATQVIGRGSRLHFLTDTSWYQLGTADIPG